MADISPSAYLSNWKNSDLPFLEKVAVAARNQAIKISTGSSAAGTTASPAVERVPTLSPVRAHPATITTTTTDVR